MLASHVAGLLVLSCVVVSSCSQADSDTARRSAVWREKISCGDSAATPDADPWLPTNGSYVATKSQGDHDVWFAQVTGAVYLQERLYVFDAQRPGIVVFDEGLAAVADSFGAKGEGPGEFRGVAYAGDGVARWLTRAGEAELLVFDGYRVQRFDAGGRYLGIAMEAPARAGITPNSVGLDGNADSLIYFVGGYDPFGNMVLGSEGSRPVYHGRLDVKGRRTTLLDLTLPILPKDNRGVETALSRQARPVWALGGRSVWVTDGSRAMFHRIYRDGTERDSIALQIAAPDPPQPNGEEEELLGQMGIKGSVAEPSALWRIRDLVFDPYGRLWIRLNSSEPRGRNVAVAVVNPETSKVDVFNVPAFPLVFGKPGVFYGVARDSTGQPHIVRLALQHGAVRKS